MDMIEHRPWHCVLQSVVRVTPGPDAAGAAAHVSKVMGWLISAPVNEAAIGRRTPGSTATS